MVVCVEVHVIWISLRGGAFGDEEEEEEEEGRVYSNLQVCVGAHR
jgi:hypothetical protein